ncbi:radical SAM protein [Clostridia bacterium]|nr:radical SAM protein [Clostridia bacterium]
MKNIDGLFRHLKKNFDVDMESPNPPGTRTAQISSESVSEAKGILITAVQPDSPAGIAGIEPGERLISVNGNKISDVLDYLFYTMEAKLSVKLTRGGDTPLFGRSVRKVSVKKDETAALGLEFETYLMDSERRCCNNCVFCFIEQLPPNMRQTLYFKDDDTRLSFLQGNYASLTNLSDREVERIIDMKLAMNVSVHTTNPPLRSFMLGNKKGGESLRYLHRLVEAGVPMNVQIVVCPGLNDGEELKSTLADLTAMHPAVGSVAVVPVGLTKYRENLPKIQPFTKETAEDVLRIVDEYGNHALELLGTRVFYPADEFFLLAERDVPEYNYYDPYFAQYENGVGMLTCLEYEFLQELKMFEPGELPVLPGKKTVVTGKAAEHSMKQMIDALSARLSGGGAFRAETMQVRAIVNRFFGESVTVAGLVTGGDIIEQLLREKGRLGTLLIPHNMLRADTTVFLDDVTVAEVEEALGAKVVILEIDGCELFSALIAEDVPECEEPEVAEAIPADGEYEGEHEREHEHEHEKIFESNEVLAELRAGVTEILL